MHTKRSGEPDVFSENKPNLLNSQMNVSKVLTKGYENKRLCGGGENKAKTKPIQSQNKANLLDSQMNITKVLTKDYENVRLGRGGENKAKTKPIKPNLP